MFKSLLKQKNNNKKKTPTIWAVLLIPLSAHIACVAEFLLNFFFQASQLLSFLPVSHAP